MFEIRIILIYSITSLVVTGSVKSKYGIKLDEYKCVCMHSYYDIDLFRVV